MSGDLLDLLGWTPEVENWKIVGEWGRCGLCGAKCSFNQGGSRTGAVCDACAQVEGCKIRPHAVEIGRRRRCAAAVGLSPATK